MASQLRVGMIGTGFGSLVQIPAFRAHGRAEVVAVASGTPGKAKKTADTLSVPHAFDDWRKLVAADLDLVSITTPPSLHHPMALAALAAGKHVLCEKPMAMSTAEADDMLAHGNRARRVHMIDHELRFNPNRRKVRRLIEKGFIGAPRHALLTVVNAGRHDPSKPWGWWYDETQGGGLLGAVGSHQVDLLARPGRVREDRIEVIEVPRRLEQIDLVGVLPHGHHVVPGRVLWCGLDPEAHRRSLPDYVATCRP